MAAQFLAEDLATTLAAVRDTAGEARRAVDSVIAAGEAALTVLPGMFGDELREALADLGDARVVILTGAGRGFCAGQDLNDRNVAPGEKVDLGETVERDWNPLVRAIAALPQPVIARVNGVAAGTVDYPVTGWENWQTSRRDVTLRQGDNTITFGKGANFAEIDAIDVS